MLAAPVLASPNDRAEARPGDIVLAASTRPTEALTQTHPEWEIPRDLLHQQDVPPLSFVEERAALLDRLGVAMEGWTPAEPMNFVVIERMLELAELHYRHALAPEGLSILDRLPEGRMTADQRVRRTVLELALGVINPVDTPLTARAERLLTSGYTLWPEQPVFLALAAIRRGDIAAAAPWIAEVRDRLDHYPPGYRADVLPGLLETAITAQEWRVARDLAGQFHEFPGLADGAAFNFLLGRAAESGDDLLAAFDAYSRAAGQGDLWGHRARMALVAMGLRNEVLGVEQARDMLRQEAETWRGDRYALRVLEDLAALDQALGDDVAAVTTYGAILDRYPQDPATTLARQKARALIAEIYKAGASGELPLGEFLTAHRAIAPDFRFEAGFAEQAELFANRFLDAGSTLVAAREFELIHDHLAVARDLGLQEVDDLRLDELRLKQAESLMRGGQYDAATMALADPLLTGNAAMEDQRTQLLARLYAETGQSGAVVETHLNEPTTEFLRLKAAAYFDREGWAPARDTYQLVWDRLGDDLPFEDAVNFLLSAYRDGDAAKTLELSQAFPDLTSLPQWSTIAQSLTDAPAELWPLRKDTADARVESARRTLENLEAAESGTN